jgi:hypothetical protein
MTDDDLLKFSEHAKELWNSGIMDDAHAKAMKTFSKRYADGCYDFTERNKKLSESMTKLYLNGGPAWAHGSYHSLKTKLVCYYRSSWELILFKQLDDDASVLFWEPEFTSILYVIGGKQHRYIPDVHVEYIDGTNKLIEVKPIALRTTERNSAKREAALTYCTLNNWCYEEWAPSNDEIKLSNL